MYFMYDDNSTCFIIKRTHKLSIIPSSSDGIAERVLSIFGGNTAGANYIPRMTNTFKKNALGVRVVNQRDSLKGGLYRSTRSGYLHA